MNTNQYRATIAFSSKMLHSKGTRVYFFSIPNNKEEKEKVLEMVYEDSTIPKDCSIAIINIERV